ncbi:MAG TPA: Si-specific NAD(P)(+) transhydrogenase [Candidatus Binataceae bacterium]|nr:Si-specific NAD(P)(+) transhydrogenase [Candidatus Binataceae bacterium]
MFDYDLIVIGSGPAGHRGAVQAARLRKRVALVERGEMVGGVCVNTGTIPSKTMREALMYLSGYREHLIYGISYSVKQKITMKDLMFRVGPVVRHEIDIMRHQLLRNGVELLTAEASFSDPHTVQLHFSDGHRQGEITGENILIATGSEAIRDSHIPFDGRYIFSSDDILTLDELPKTLAVVGAGVIGCEYASMFAALGVKVTLIDKRTRLLPFVDGEIVEALTYHLRENRVTLRLGEEVSTIVYHDDGRQRPVELGLASGKHIIEDKALYSIGRCGAVGRLNLQATGVEAEEKGRIKVTKFYQTNVPHIYAAGDVVGFPALAATSMEQGRVAVAHAFQNGLDEGIEFFPYGIYTVPEVSYVGRNEEELTAAGVPYEVGKARYREIARGQIIGDEIGMLKLLFHADTREMLGVHIIGEGACELIHTAGAVLSLGGKLDYFLSAVFNYPTLGQCYKIAALDGMSRLGH